MKKFKQFFEEKIILSAVMCVLLAVVLVTATYGWYALNNTDKAYGLDLKTGGDGGIKVAIVKGGDDIMVAEDIKRIEEDGKIIARIPISLYDLNYENIEKGKIAPGAWGDRTLYITSLSESIRSYTIRVQFEYMPDGDESAGELTDEEKQNAEKVKEMIMDHFTIYQTKTTRKVGDEEIVSFEDPLTLYSIESDQETTGSNQKMVEARGSLQFNVEKPVKLYWVWNYELTDIPEFWELERFSNYKFIDAIDPTDGSVILNDVEVRKGVRKYDEEDTELGNYLDHIYFNIFVEGNFETYHDSDSNKGYTASPGTRIVNMPAVNNAADTNAQGEDGSGADAGEESDTYIEENPETEDTEDDTETEGVGEGATVDTENNSGVDTEGGSEGVRD